MNLEDLDDLHNILNNKEKVIKKKAGDCYEEVSVSKKMVQSSSKARKQFFEEKENNMPNENVISAVGYFDGNNSKVISMFSLKLSSLNLNLQMHFNLWQVSEKD